MKFTQLFNSLFRSPSSLSPEGEKELEDDQATLTHLVNKISSTYTHHPLTKEHVLARLQNEEMTELFHSCYRKKSSPLQVGLEEGATANDALQVIYGQCEALKNLARVIKVSIKRSGENLQEAIFQMEEQFNKALSILEAEIQAVKGNKIETTQREYVRLAPDRLGIGTKNLPKLAEEIFANQS